MGNNNRKKNFQPIKITTRWSRKEEVCTIQEPNSVGALRLVTVPQPDNKIFQPSK